MKGSELIAAERERQIAKERWDAKHDAEHDQGELIAAAMCYATQWPMKLKIPVAIYGDEHCGCREFDCPHRSMFPAVIEKWVEDPWPWHDYDDKRMKHNRLRRLVIAGALIAAEIDRLLSITPNPAQAGSPVKSSIPLTRSR